MRILYDSQVIPDRLPDSLWHGTKHIDYIAKDDMVMKAKGLSGYVEGIRFTSDPRLLADYANYPFWIEIDTSNLRVQDFDHVGARDIAWASEDEYLYVGGSEFDLKPHLRAIYVAPKVREFFEDGAAGMFYKNLKDAVERYNIELVLDQDWLW